MTQALANSIKELEGKFSMLLEEGKPYVIRLDGCTFKKFTTGMVRPFDQRLTLAMVRTMNDLVEHFNPLFAFSQSDEISLVFRGDREREYYPYGGRVIKLCSIAAGFASARFNAHIASFDWSDRMLELQHRVRSGGAHFDARVFSVPDQKTAADAIIWRHLFDCRRNAIHTIGVTHLGHRTIHALNIGEIISMLLLKKNIDVARDTPRIFLFGTFCKKALVPLPFTHPITKETGIVMRSRVENRVFDMSGMRSADIISIIFDQHWSMEHPVSLCDMRAILDEHTSEGDQKVQTNTNSSVIDAKVSPDALKRPLD